MIIGIDLGTTNSLVAAWKDGRSVLIPNALGETLTPSCVSLDEDVTVLVGRAARERLQTHPDRTAANFKRYMGSDRTVALAGRAFRPEELSSLVLRALKADAEAFLGEPVEEAVVTVPAYFSDAQRKATRAAGALAGLRVDRLLNEPTAAALAYGLHQQDSETRFLVFDLGGGTFDVSILEMFDGVMEVRASAGDNFLGGEDFLQALVDLFFERLKLSESLRRDSHFMQRLLAAAERTKRALSEHAQAVLSVEHGESPCPSRWTRPCSKAPAPRCSSSCGCRWSGPCATRTCAPSCWTTSCWPAAPPACRWSGGSRRRCSAAFPPSISTRTRWSPWARPSRPA